MERIWIHVVTIWVLMAAGTAGADTVMMRTPAAPTAAERAERQEVYPASEFGKPPVRKSYPMVSDPLTASQESNAWPAGEPVAGAGRGRPEDSAAGPPDGAPVAPPTEGRALASVNALTPPAGMDTQAIRRKGVQEIAVIAGDSGFFPKTLFVTRDIPVRLFVTGASKNTLCMMMDSFQVRKQIRSQRIEEISFTPGVPGKYRFHCPVNGMEGNLIVRELTAVETE